MLWSGRHCVILSAKWGLRESKTRWKESKTKGRKGKEGRGDILEVERDPKEKRKLGSHCEEKPIFIFWI